MEPKLPFRLLPVAAALAGLGPLPVAALQLGVNTPPAATVAASVAPPIERVATLRARLLQHDAAGATTPVAGSAPVLAQSWNNWKKWNNA